MAFALTSPAFVDGNPIPAQFTMGRYERAKARVAAS